MSTNMDMMTWFISLGHWNWFIAAAVLFLIEILAPGSFMMWLGLAALLVGGISLAVDWGWQAQIIAFAVFSIACIPAWRRLARKVEGPVDRPFLNRRAEGYVGRIFTLDKPIVDGVGTIRIDDTVWRVSGPDCPAGSRVKIARAEGAELMVETSTQ
jgi:inner membrane protein